MIVTKAVALVEDVEASDEYPNGAFEVILSAATLDRDGEIIDARAFDPLPDHIPFDIDHGMTVMTTIGSGTPKYNDAGQLVVKGGYASTALAQEVRTLVSEGHVRTTSVTFMAADRKKDAKGVPHVIKAELLNGTFTPVPSNRESVVLSSKSLYAVTAAKATVKEKAGIQDAHDVMVGLGAACSAEKSSITEAEAESIPAEAKAIVGSLEAIRERVSDALSDLYPLRYCYIRGVLTDSVVFDVWTESEYQTYQQTYTDDGAIVTLTGTPVEVDIVEVVTPDADAALEPDGEKSAAEAAEGAAPQGTADSTAEPTDEDLQTLALKGINENAARLAFGG